VIFDVAQDVSRPFVIDGGLVRITVLGTRFAVDRFAGKERVSVDHGRVRLTTGSVWNRQTLVLEDGQVAEVDSLAEGIAPPRRIDRPAMDAFAFEQGTIVFDGASLGEIAEMLSRYRGKPVRVGPGADTIPPFTAVAHLSNLEGFLTSLSRIYPVSLTEEPSQTLLSARR
jgi:transmembrane sensor